MKKIFFLLTAMLLGTDLWAETVSYLYPEYNDGAPAKGIKEWKTGSVDATEITNASDTLNAGWYVVAGEDVQTHGLVCNGAVHLILADGAKLTATGEYPNPGIKVPGNGNSLTIYGQTGQLIAYAGGAAAGIGGGWEVAGADITVNGGIVTAIGKDGAGIGGGGDGSGSNITINGGTVTATSSSGGAGIGGGRWGSCSNITINGGIVTATGGSSLLGGDGGAGIGSGWGVSASNITINGGTITATGGDGGAGIGGGKVGSGSNIRINGGTVVAIGGKQAAGIGGGESGEGSNITINGAMVTATGGDEAAGIGGGEGGNGSDITIYDGTVTATGGNEAAGIGGGNFFAGSNITIHGGIVTANGGNNASGIGGGHYASGYNILVDIRCEIKADGNKPPTTVIDNDGSDVAEKLKYQQYATVTELPQVKVEAIAEIDAAIEGITYADVLSIADKAKTDINDATTIASVNSIKTKALADILSAIKACANAEIDAVIEGIPDPDILAVADKEKTDINAAENKEDVNSIKTQALEKLEFLVRIYKSGESNAFPVPTQPGMRMKVTKKDGKVYEFQVTDMESTKYYRATE